MQSDEQKSDERFLNFLHNVCILSPGSIVRLGLIGPYGNPNTADFSKTPKQINNMIEAGDQCFFTLEGGKEDEVAELGDDFIRTRADDTVKNNLRHLRDCRGSVRDNPEQNFFYFYFNFYF